MSLADDARWCADNLDHSITLTKADNAMALLNSCADELDRLNKRLETSPDHPFDGIECRDESIKMLERELAAAKRDAERFKRERDILADDMYLIAARETPRSLPIADFAKHSLASADAAISAQEPNK
jgi:hypothetical protein